MKLLLDHIASGAFHDAAERGDPPKCHKDTRKMIIAQIMNWIFQPNMSSYSLLWLSGPAGAGKSAIMQTIAEMLVLQGILLGSFFFARTAPERNNPSRFIATLAYQLALAIPEMQERVIDAVEEDPTIFTRKLATQAEVLIIQPLKAMLVVRLSGPPPGWKSRSGWRSKGIFLMVALDECVSATAQREVLNVIAKISAEINELSDNPIIHFVISSRPEYEFRQAFDWHGDNYTLARTTPVVLQPNYDVDLDIQVFLEATFQKIKDTHPVRAHLPQDWPTAHQMKYLVDTSSGHFIYAATAAKYVVLHVIIFPLD